MKTGDWTAVACFCALILPPLDQDQCGRKNLPLAGNVVCRVRASLVASPTVSFTPRFKSSIMVIYGTALLAGCLLIGMLAGRSIGVLLGVDADIGGVGIAMILLIVSCDWLQRCRLMKAPTESGIVFWGSIYVPIVVAMAASQNVYGALTGGLMAAIAGATGVVICFALVGLFIRLSHAADSSSNSTRDQSAGSVEAIDHEFKSQPEKS